MATPDAREFHPADILSITSGRLVSPRKMEGVYAILSHMTGEDLYTHQLPRAKEACAPFLLAQHPHLADVDCTGVTEANHARWLREIVARFGKALPVAPLPPGEDGPRDPVAELEAMVGKDRACVVNVDAEREV